MSVYNSEIYLRNDGYQTIQIGTLSISPNETIKIWDTKNVSATDVVWERFYEVMNNHDDDDVYGLLTSEDLVVIHDGLDVSSQTAPSFLSNAYAEYSRISSVKQLMSTGIKLSESKDDKGRIIFVPEGRVGNEIDVASHNFSDKTTWYGESVYTSDEIATDQGDGFFWDLPHDFIIDLTHGKVHNEDLVMADAYHQYDVVVTVDGYEVTGFPLYGEYSNDGYDYVLDYRAGTIAFNEDQSGKDVRASYAYATGSSWVLKPEDGQVIKIEDSEVQFSKNTVFTDIIVVDIRAYNPQDLPNKVSVLKRRYKNISNFIDEARGCYPVISIGEFSEDILGFPFSYRTVRELSSSLGLEIVVKTENDRELLGEKTTATYYCVVTDEES